jgi:hypothetical protein
MGAMSARFEMLVLGVLVALLVIVAHSMEGMTLASVLQ